MIESTVRRPQPLEIDLLPWADPYIAQLFQEAQLLGPSNLTGFAMHAPCSPPDGQRAQSAVKAPWDRPLRVISRPLPRSAPRRQKTESARLLARC
jgi:hypothetical protein